jgi:hypothetical protein
MNDRAKRYRELCREAARQLKTKATDERVIHVATLRLMREAIQAKLIAGHHVDPADLLKLDEALRTYVPKEQHRVNIQFVGTIDRCPKCGYERPESPELSPAPKPSPPAIPASAPPAPNVVQLKSPRSIHDGAPLKSV